MSVISCCFLGIKLQSKSAKFLSDESSIYLHAINSNLFMNACTRFQHQKVSDMSSSLKFIIKFHTFNMSTSYSLIQLFEE
jgi:hypothetical protein